MFQRELKTETSRSDTLHLICCLLVHHWIHSRPYLHSCSTFITSITWPCALCHSEAPLPVPLHATQIHTHTEGGFQTHTQTPQISVLSLAIIHPPVSHCTLKLCAIWTALNPVHICYTVLSHLPLGCWSHTLSHWLFIIVIIAIIMRWEPCRLSNAAAQWCQLGDHFMSIYSFFYGQSSINLVSEPSAGPQ